MKQINEKLLFVVKATLISLVLFFVIWPIVSIAYAAGIKVGVNVLRGLFTDRPALGSIREKYSYFLIPALSVIIAASGTTIQRKLDFSLIAVAVRFCFDAITIAFGVNAYAGAATVFGDSAGSSTEVVLYHSFTWTFPILIVFIFMAGKPDILWRPKPAKDSNVKRCPICGEDKVGLAEHVKSVHGEKHLNDWWVRRALSR